ncbi:MAG: homoserine kinase [Thaumarchaeota archaeon]|nr:MAG: homoserine kinase [Nitrososphaerota archaeon]
MLGYGPCFSAEGCFPAFCPFLFLELVGKLFLLPDGLLERMIVRAPATSANLGSGFDVFGMALREPYDLVEVRRIPEKAVRIRSTAGYQIPLNPEENTGGYVALELMKAFDLPEGVELKIWKRIRPGSGLGSSAATAAAVAYAVNLLFDLRLSREDLISYAALGEKVSAGTPHPDNVAPAICGGFVIVSSRDPLKVYSIEPPEELGVVVALPEFEKGSTRRAREVIPREVPLSSLVHNVGRASTLAAGMALKNINMIKDGMKDAVIEPARAKAGMIPEYEEVRRLGERLDAGIAVSGAGPAVIGLIEKGRRAELAEALKELYASRGYRCEVYVTEPGPGVSEIEEVI